MASRVRNRNIKRLFCASNLKLTRYIVENQLCHAKATATICHSERSEESLLAYELREIYCMRDSSLRSE